MKKMRLLCGVMLLLVGLTSCGQEKSDMKQENRTSNSITDEEGLEGNGKQEGTNLKDQQIDNTDRPEDESGTKVNIYYSDNEHEGLISEVVEIKELDAQLIWQKLQNAGMIDSAAAILEMKINSKEGEIILDLNEKFGEQLRSKGTTGERELLDSVVYTFLEAYQCDKIQLKEEGGVLISSHKEYSDYLTKEQGE